MEYMTEEERREEQGRRLIKFLFPKGGSGWAKATGVSIVLIELLIGIPFVLPFGILALRDIKKHPEKTGKGVAWLGVILGTLLYLFVIFLLLID